MRRSLVVGTLLGCVACAPSLDAPGEVIRISGQVVDETGVPVEVEVYERCSPHLYVFESCPGKQLGRAKIPKPGSFLVAVQTEAKEVSVVAFRGLAPGQEEQCVVRHVSTKPPPRDLRLTLERGPCPIERPAPITASARAPFSAY